MTKIKTFEFMVTTHHGNAQYVRPRFSRESWADAEKITSPEEIDKTVNDFISANARQLIDIKVEHYVAERNNNGYCDIVIAKYTIIYK